jgi:hypothetical protein
MPAAGSSSSSRRGESPSEGCDLIVLNGPGNVGADDAVVEFFSPSEGWTGPFRGSKASVARRIVRLIEAVRACRTIRLTR